MSRVWLLTIALILSIYGSIRLQNHLVGQVRREKTAKRGLSSEALKQEQKQILAQLDLRKSMHLEMTDEFIAAFEENRFNHLPDIVITGQKKCGTKALLTFLLQHPNIRGCREEFHWHDTGDFNRELKSFLGHIGIANQKRNFNLEPGTFMITKTGNPAVWKIAENAKHVNASVGLTKSDIDKWRDTIIAIDCLCDPVKRLFSDFLHVQATHTQRDDKPNSQFLGADSKLFPFANLTFADFVEKYLPLWEQLDDENVVKKMFSKGTYTDLLIPEREFYGDRLILVDGGIFKINPWSPLAQVERALFPDEKNVYFTRKRFHKRDDGHYCLVLNLQNPPTLSNLVCMPKSKGRSKDETIPEDIRTKLEEFYYPLNKEAGIEFSWL